MYQMWYGVSLYEKAVQQAREDQARKENKKPEEINADLSTVNFEKPHAAPPGGGQAQQGYVARALLPRPIYREQDKPKEAAEEFSRRCRRTRASSGPYVALGELYRKWDYTDEAIKVASQGAANVPGANEVSDIWYVLGMGYDDKSIDDKAIEAFDKAIESRKRDNHKAKFQRGQAYFRKGDMTHAKRDLEEFSKSGGASLEFAKQQASKMLMDIAAKSAGDARQGARDEVSRGACQWPPRARRARRVVEPSASGVELRCARAWRRRSAREQLAVGAATRRSDRVLSVATTRFARAALSRMLDASKLRRASMPRAGRASENRSFFGPGCSPTAAVCRDKNAVRMRVRGFFWICGRIDRRWIRVRCFGNACAGRATGRKQSMSWRKSWRLRAPSPNSPNDCSSSLLSSRM